ncbi:MAG: twin-arginine translocase TatA/TatE family subunit [Lentisphaeria bacterium]|nr:twin-arginine translocase TatA/TatE family subunit [Lentisphaeria bacterium]
MGIGWTELIVIFCVVLLFFGARRIPEVARALGRASREFKNARDSVVDEVKESFSEEETKRGKKTPPPEKQLPEYDKKDE